MRDRRYLAERGQELLSLGYEPVPVQPGSKAPSIKQWQTVEVTPERIDAWLANGSANAGVGIRTGRVCAIDIDITSEAAVKRVVAWCEQHLGPTHRKQGQAPKVTLLYRRHTPGPKMSSALYNDWEGATHRVEILGTGQQTVMYHTHPVTGKPYRHSSKQLPPLSELPVVTDDELRQLLSFVDELAQDLCWDRHADAQSPSAQDNPDWDEDERALAHLVPPVGVSLDEAAELISHIDPEPHDDWYRVGMALKHEFGEAGRQLWEDWSSTAPNVGGLHRWDSFDQSPQDRDPVTMRSIRKMVADLLQADPAAQVGDEPAASDDPLQLFGWRDASPDTTPPHQVVEELLVRGTLSLVSAQPNTGKSALILDLVAHVARGAPWRGLQVEQGGVLYVAAESPESIRARVLAMKGATGWDDADLMVTRAPVSLTSVDQRKAFASAIRGHLKAHPHTSVLVVDTFRNATPGLEENDSKDMGAVIQFLAILARRTGLHIIIVHHTTKSGTSYAGSGVFGAVVDTEIRIEAGEKEMEGLVKAYVVQQRSLTSRGAEYWYRIVGRATGRTTNFGKPETAPLVEHVTEADLEFMRVEREESAKEQRESETERDLRVLLQSIEDGGTSLEARQEMTGLGRRVQERLLAVAQGQELVEKRGKVFHLTAAGRTHLETR